MRSFLLFASVASILLCLSSVSRAAPECPLEASPVQAIAKPVRAAAKVVAPAPAMDVVCPDYVTPEGTCATDPKGPDGNANTPAVPPADGLWIRATPPRGMTGCVVITTSTHVTVDAKGKRRVVIQNDPSGSHPADGTYHRL